VRAWPKSCRVPVEVTMETASDENSRERAHLQREVEAIREGLRAADAGETIPAEQFFKEMARKYGISMHDGSESC